MTVIALTGANGRLGSYLREPLARMGTRLISSDLVDDIGSLYEGEEYRRTDVSNMQQVLPMLEGVDVVVHFASIADEAPFEDLLGPNFLGSYHIWEAAHRQGVKRVVYASSIHAVGMYPRTECIGVDAPHRPDTFYGLAKCFSEDLAYLYWTKRQLESVCLRILSCAQVTSERALGTWLSYDDLIQLVTKSIEAPVVGHTIVYGVSNNDRAGVDNSGARFLGYRPKDNAEDFAEKILAERPPADPSDPAQFYHGGPFAKVDLGESGLAHMTIVDDRKQA